MKIEHLKSMFLQNKQHVAVVLLFLVFLALAGFSPGAAQLKNQQSMNQKRVTGIQLGGAAEGSRVTVLSDSPLIDYEAFRRGDRFYVKIPLADLTSVAPRFRADGFEDVQVQKVGDGLVLSFKLQPGATARVDQRGTRLDVVFSVPNRGSYITTAGTTPTRPEPYPDRGRDGAGPIPPASASSRPRAVTDLAGSVNESRSPRDPRWPSYPKTNPRTQSRRPEQGPMKAGPVTAATPVRASSPSPISSPGSSPSYQPSKTATSSALSSPAPVAGSTAGDSRWARARQWMSANRLATLLGTLILVSLIAYLVMTVRQRQSKVVKTRRATTPKVQPKYSPDEHLIELSNAGRKQAKGPENVGAQTPWATPAKEQPWTRPTIVSVTEGRDEDISEEEEREVFEL